MRVFVRTFVVVLFFLLILNFVFGVDLFWWVR